MSFYGIEIPITTFSIILIELVFLFFQVIYFLYRPSDTRRLLYLILLLLLLYYNIVCALFPNPALAVPLSLQNIVQYSAGIPMSMFFAYYFYKAFELKKLRFLATHGVFYFIFLPFIFAFLIPLAVTDNLELARKMLIVVPCFYIVLYVHRLSVSVVEKYRETPGRKKKQLIQEMAGLYIALILWISLPVWVYLGPRYETYELLTTNAGFMILTLFYIRASIVSSKKEYRKLLESEKKLQEINKDLTLKVRQRTRKLEQLNEQITNTFINIAHETKTPLTLINNYLEEYMSRHIDPHNKEELEIIKRNVDKLTADIVNFFDVERIKKGLFVYDHNKIADLSKLVGDSIPLFKQYASTQKIDLHHQIDGDLRVKADPEALYRVINNLMDNAIKFAHSRVEVAAEASGGKVRLKVQDDGAGIEPGALDHIFDPYMQVKTRKSVSQGIGMGLTIVKKIIDGVPGQINVTSGQGPGTVFEVVLPQYEGKEQPQQLDIEVKTGDAVQYRITDEVNDQRRPTLLLVEDSVPLLHYLINKLKSRYNIYAAKNGLEAYKKLQQINKLDLIVSDVMMENMDGYGLLKMMHGKNEFRHIPTIFLSAKPKREKIKALELGAVDFIPKPFSINELVGKIESILNVLSAQRSALITHAYNSIVAPADKGLLLAGYNFTKREEEIINFILEGRSYRDIGQSLNISHRTVSKHMQNIYEKAGVSSKIELLRKLNLSNLT